VTLMSYFFLNYCLLKCKIVFSLLIYLWYVRWRRRGYPAIGGRGGNLSMLMKTAKRKDMFISVNFLLMKNNKNKMNY